MIVNDGDIAPTAFNFDIAVAQEIVGVYDADDITDKINLLDLYITSLKHPTAIYLKDDFIDEYGCVESFDDDKFVFMSIFTHFINSLHSFSRKSRPLGSSPFLQSVA